MGIDERMAEIL